MDQEVGTFDRLHALVRKGYKPVLGTDEAGTDAIRLTYIGPSPDLILHQDGRIEPVRERLPRHKRKLPAIEDIENRGASDQVRFLQFVDNIAKPTFSDKTRRWRTRWVYGPLFLLVLWGLSLAFTAMVIEGL